MSTFAHACVAGLSLAMLTAPLLSAAEAVHSEPASLAAYRHKSRLLVLLASSKDDPAFRKQQDLWAGARQKFPEYDLVEIPLLGQGRERSEIARHYGLSPSQFAVLLIGKDGHEASRSLVPVPAEKILGQIDAMPMRQAEAKARQRGR